MSDNNQDRSQDEGQGGIDRETEQRNRENETGQAGSQQSGQGQNQQFGQRQLQAADQCVGEPHDRQADCEERLQVSGVQEVHGEPLAPPWGVNAEPIRSDDDRQEWRECRHVWPPRTCGVRGMVIGKEAPA